MRNPISLNSTAPRASMGLQHATALERAPWLVLGLLLAAAALVAPRAQAQQTPPPASPGHDSPSPADLEPGVNTSAPPPPDSTAPAAPASEVKSRPADAGKSPTVRSKADTPAPTPGADAKPTNETRVAKATTAKGAPTGGNKGSGKAEDHLQLDTTDITGNQELPKVLYIVPWKRSDLGDLLGKPANSLIDEVLQPVDRDVFRRENRYYDAVKPDANDNAGGGAGGTSADKR